MFKIKLKNDLIVTVREASKDDAQSIIDFYNIVGGETNFLSFGENEFKRDLEEYKTSLTNSKEQQNTIILLVTLNEQIISIASIHSSQAARTKHVGTLGIVIKKEYWGLQLGNSLMEYLIDWSKQNTITRKIQLTCNEDNTKAIRLYKKLGFEIEGIIKEDTFIDGRYYHTVLMGLFL
ncbi:GNAT family N-acetyltransferase [Gottfriedia solisilvae]|uniref:GNAT family N-acetyltransferase n=1 Tax=Gottfriedia solisilvae TaxID=1516104 RepID=UPI003D2F0ED8